MTPEPLIATGRSVARTRGIRWLGCPDLNYPRVRRSRSGEVNPIEELMPAVARGRAVSSSKGYGPLWSVTSTWLASLKHREEDDKDERDGDEHDDRI